MTVDERTDDVYVEVDAVLADWRQGDCLIGESWFVHRVDPERPLTSGSEGAEGELVEIAVRGFVVVSQTCDVVRSSKIRPYIEISPLVEVSTSDLYTIERGRRPQYAYVPGVADDALVADLDRTMTVEKSVLMRWERRPGCQTDEQQRAFAQALKRKRGRFAFPDDFVAIAGKLSSRIQEKHDKQSPEGRALRALREIRVRAAPKWDAPSVDVTFWFVREESQPDFEGTSWDALRKKWLLLVQKTGRYTNVDGAVVELADLTAQEYVESDALDLDHLTTRA